MYVTYRQLLVLVSFEQSNCTPRCSWRVSAAGLPWLKHFGVQCYTKVKSLLVGFRENPTELKDLCFVLLEIESLRVQSLWLLKKL